MEFDSAEGFPSVIRAARKAKGLSQVDVAEALDLRQPSVSSWESGRSLPTIPLLVALAKLLDLDPGRLVSLAAAAGDESEAVAL